MKVSGFKLKEVHTWKLSLKCPAPLSASNLSRLSQETGRIKAKLWWSLINFVWRCMWSPPSHETIYTWNSTYVDLEMKFLKIFYLDVKQVVPLSQNIWNVDRKTVDGIFCSLDLPISPGPSFGYTFLGLAGPGKAQCKQAPWEAFPGLCLALLGCAMVAHEPSKSSALSARATLSSSCSSPSPTHPLPSENWTKRLKGKILAAGVPAITTSWRLFHFPWKFLTDNREINEN